MCLYLTKRGATYYFRRVIPDELRPAFNGAGEFMFSLRTKDREEAKRRRSTEALRTDRELEQARARLTSPAAPERPPTPPSRALSDFEIEQAELQEQDEGERQARREELSDYIDFLRDRLRGSTRQMPRELRAFRYILEGHEFDAALLKDQLTIARAEKTTLEARLAQGSSANTATSPGEVPALIRHHQLRA